MACSRRYLQEVTQQGLFPLDERMLFAPLTFVSYLMVENKLLSIEIKIKYLAKNKYF